MNQTHCAPRAVLTAFALTTAVLLPGHAARAATLVVGPGQSYTTIAAAVAAAKDGDTVQVMAGTYVNDFADIQHNITLTAVGGRVVMRATGYIPNEKGILVADADLTVTGFSFMGAKVTNAAGGNGAGIRYDSGNMAINDCYFAYNQNGILANAWPGATITITSSEFYDNGVADGPSSGSTHNIYINEVATLDIENSYFHGAQVGHEIKSRADTTIVRNTRVVDGPNGTASYSIDLPNGGVATIENDKIEQGPLSQNPLIIAFGEEGNLHAGSALTVSANWIDNDLNSPDAVAVWNAGGAPTTVTGNSVYGLVAAQMLHGVGTLSDTTYLKIEPKFGNFHPWSPP